MGLAQDSINVENTSNVTDISGPLSVSQAANLFKKRTTESESASKTSKEKPAQKEVKSFKQPQEDEEEDGGSEEEELNVTAQNDDGNGDDEAGAESEENETYELDYGGQKIYVTVDELMSGYMKQKDYTTKTQKLSEASKELENKLSLFTESIKSASSMAKAMEQEMMEEYNTVNWKELREIDPAEFAAKYTEFQHRSMKINNYKNMIAQEEAKVNGEKESKHRQKVTEETQLLLSKIPSWSKAEVSKAESAEINAYLLGEGFSPQEIAGIIDHRLIIAHRKAMLYDKLQRSKPKVDNKIKNVPKFVKPGSKQDSGGKKSAYDAVRQKLAKTGKVQDAAALFKLRMTKR